MLRAVASQTSGKEPGARRILSLWGEDGALRSWNAEVVCCISNSFLPGDRLEGGHTRYSLHRRPAFSPLASPGCIMTNFQVGLLSKAKVGPLAMDGTLPRGSSAGVFLVRAAILVPVSGLMGRIMSSLQSWARKGVGSPGQSHSRLGFS